MKNIAAALVFFTRLPFWRLKMFNVPAQYYKQVINYWSLVGWLTGGVMALTFWLGSFFFAQSVCVILALLSRLLITGALHEDGLADFFDGFGGGRTKERILEIMKDSHIGTYGVLALVLYFLLGYQVLNSISFERVLILLFVADPLCKFIASWLTLFLPYARTEETSKAKVVYNKMSVLPFTISLVFGVLPILVLFPPQYWLVTIFPIITFFALILLMKKKIGGYTGDCCGALFLMCELSFYIGFVIVVHTFIG